MYAKLIKLISALVTGLTPTSTVPILLEIAPVVQIKFDRVVYKEQELNEFEQLAIDEEVIANRKKLIEKARKAYGKGKVIVISSKKC